jgi:DNA-binding NarL/FixJ family response regulator
MGARPPGDTVTISKTFNCHVSPPTRVLLVDDSIQVRQDLRQLLELSGQVQVVGEAGNGWDAVQMAEQLHPQVVLMDLEMPVMDGIHATRLIKASEKPPWVIILTIHADAERQQRGLMAGADRFIAKGAGYETLLNAILELDGPILKQVKGEGK